MRQFSVAAAMAACMLAQPVCAQELAIGPVYDARTITDLDKGRDAEYRAVLSLLERWGLVGVAYADNKVRPAMAITRGEAAVLLSNALDTARTAIFTVQDSYNGSMPAAMAARFDTLSASYIPTMGCGVMDEDMSTASASTPQMGQAAERLAVAYEVGGLAASPQDFGYSELLDWGTALRCLPMADKGAQPLVNSQGEPMEAEVPITRGDYLVLMDRALGSFYDALQDAELSD
ncbi:hypothetical protein [Altererythrobacter fulvus]|uniref:hypothetical protein n=1 Tax=Caenibius fulvus TaxID=2126012 RepID=UPI003017FB53